jgi:hypothetical protein
MRSSLMRSTIYEVLADASCKDILAPQPGKNLRPLVIHEGQQDQQEVMWQMRVARMFFFAQPGKNLSRKVPCVPCVHKGN